MGRLRFGALDGCLDLAREDERRFGNGVVYLGYRVR
jgi:hypothetical protein